MVPLVPRDLVVPQALMVLRVPLAHKAQQALMVLRVPLAHRALPVQLVQLELTA
jgi:hypothetical protein